MEIAEIKVSYSNHHSKRIKISNSSSSYNLLVACWNKQLIELQEEFKVLLLNRANQVLGIYSLSKGGVSGTVVDIKLLLSVTLKANASNIIIAHNHPSGNLKPSISDIKITDKIKKACEYLDIQLLDHLILSKNSYYSFADDYKI